MFWLRRNAAPSNAPQSTASPESTDSGSHAPFAATMMDYPLTTRHIFDRAQKLFAKQELVTITADGYERSNYGEMCDRAQKVASALNALGIKRGDRVGTLAWNTTRHYELYFAIPTMGAVLHTLNLRLSPDQLGYIIRDGGDRIIFVDADLLPLLEKCKPFLESVEHIFVMNGTATPSESGLPLVMDYEELVKSAPAGFQWPDLDEREACAMCYTSGTTGNPKGVVYSHRSTVLHAISVTMADTIAVSGQDAIMPIVPMFHVNAWGIPHAAAMVGSRLIFPGKFMIPDRIALAMQEERVTVGAGVPTVWLGLLNALAQKTYDLSTVRALVCGGSAAPAALIRNLDKFNLPILHAWGMTEMSPIGTVSRLKAGLEKLPYEEQLAYRAKQGMPVPGVDIRIMNLETGQEAPWDGVTFGEIQVRGPWITASYYHGDDLEQGESKFIDGWFRTGDVATIDAAGYIEIVDRTKDVIKSGGEWISSVQLEGLILGHPRVAESAVIGMPHPKWQERPVAVVVMKQGETPVTKDEINEYLAPHVAKWWLVDAVVITETIPKTSVGKIDKKVLRAELADRVQFSDI